MTAIRVDGLAKRYDNLSVLDDLSFEVDDGAVFGLLGPNGAGKTTTIDILTGVTAPDGGEVRVLDIDPASSPVEVREHVGILPEKESPPSFLTPREYFEFVADVRDLNQTVVDERVTEWADRLDFEDKLDVLCKDLSRGQQQKVMLTQSLLHEPDLVFIDEPLANLDPVMQERVKEFIREYHATGHTIVLCTHHIEVAEALCTDVGILNDGAFAAQFDPRDLGGDETVRDIYLDAMDATRGESKRAPDATSD
jgi:ABC-2 type transport system ATP-binding protein